MSSEFVFTLVFFLLIAVLLVFDLGVFNKKDHIISNREAAGWTILWVFVSFCWYSFLALKGELLHSIDSIEKLRVVSAHFHQDVNILPDNLEASLAHYRSILSMEYLTGYLVEYSLSIDNIFVMILVFSAFGVEKRYYHRVLFWGILGAVVFRLIFIFAGAYLISRFGWILYVFAAFLIFTGVRMFLTRNKEEELDVANHPVVKLSGRFFRVTKDFVGSRFFVKKDGLSYITPLLIVLLIIEFTDIIFAVDSIPAIFAVTKDPYIVFFSNIFAILGLRTLFFLLINVMDKMRFFKHGLSFLLVFIGLKMVFNHWLHEHGFSSVQTLLVILAILGLSVISSLLFPAPQED